MESKLCSTCKINKSLIEFGKSKPTKDGYQYQCKLCAKQYHLNNIDKAKLYYQEYRSNHKYEAKQYRINHKNETKEYSKQYYIDNADKKNQYRKQYFIDNPDKLKQYYLKNKDKIKQYYLKNKDKKKEYQLKNKDKISKYIKEYFKTEKGKLIAKSNYHKRRILLKTNTSSGNHWKPDDIKLKLKLQHSKCVYCKTLIKKYYEIDHIIPVSKGGSNEPSNIQLLCKNCNRLSGKGAKLPDEFAKKHGMLF